MPTPDAPGGIDRRTFSGHWSSPGLAPGRPAALRATAEPAMLAQGQAPQPPPKITREMPVATETGMSLSSIGRLFGEADLLTVGEAYQAATDFHRRRTQKLS